VVSVDDLAARVPRVQGLLVEHIVSRRDDTGATASVLVDQWGRSHALGAVTTLGRGLDAARIAILEHSVSRLHAELRQQAGDWVLRDLGSTNGTFIDGERLAAPRSVADRQLVAIGNVAFVFVLDRATVAMRRASAPASTVQQVSAMPRVAGGLRMLETAAGEGGVVELGSSSVQLGVTQLSLVMLLASRYRADRGRDPAVRGFVRAIDLITELPWDTPQPGDNNVKQLVRRVRRSLARLALEDAIESRHGFGYRLVLPGEP
jgi:hypothetical protein